MENKIYKEKDYTEWMKLKTKINNEATKYNRYREGDIVWVSLGENVGQEQDGKGELFSRPVVILRGYNASLALCVPLSTVYKEGEYYYSFKHRGKISVALLSQTRTLDLARICDHGYVGRITKRTLENMKLAYASMVAGLNLDAKTASTES